MTNIGLAAIGAAFVAVIVGGLLFASYLNPDLSDFTGVNIFDSIESPPETEDLISHGYYSENLYTAGYERVGEVDAINARSAIIAHHLVVSDEIVRVVEGLAKGNKRADTIIVISPNHFFSGHDAVQVGTAGYSTPFGDLAIRKEIAEELVEDDLVKEASLGFDGEHGIAAITPIIKRSFPNAEIVPIIVKESLTVEESKALGELLATVVDKRTVVLGSIDMSHLMPIDYQEFHDEITMNTIEAGINAASQINLEIDSNATLRTLLTLNQELGTEVWNQTYHGSTLSDSIADSGSDNTSHIIGYFTQGKPQTTPFNSWLVTSDQYLLEESTVEEFFTADRRSFGTHQVVSREDSSIPAVCQPELESVDPIYRTIGLFMQGEQCIIYPLNEI